MNQNKLIEPAARIEEEKSLDGYELFLKKDAAGRTTSVGNGFSAND